MIRFAWTAPGLALVLYVLFAASMRRDGGSLSPEAWTLAVLGISLLVLGAGWSTRWHRSAWLFALALAGQACALALIDAPSFGVYERYFSWESLTTSYRWLFLLGPLIQTITAIYNARRLRAIFSEGLRVLPVSPPLAGGLSS